jgi:hypothetical protein
MLRKFFSYYIYWYLFHFLMENAVTMSGSLKGVKWSIQQNIIRFK